MPPPTPLLLARGGAGRSGGEEDERQQGGLGQPRLAAGRRRGRLGLGGVQGAGRLGLGGGGLLLLLLRRGAAPRRRLGGGGFAALSGLGGFGEHLQLALQREEE